MSLWLEDSLHNCAHCKANKLQQDRGCPELGTNHPQIVYQIDEEIINHCLVHLVTAESITWLNEFGYIEAGIMPEAGGLNDQYERDLRVFQVIANERAALEEQKRQRR